MMIDKHLIFRRTVRLFQEIVGLNPQSEKEWDLYACCSDLLQGYRSMIFEFGLVDEFQAFLKQYYPEVYENDKDSII